MGVKKFPCCYFTHSSIEAASRIGATSDLAPADVASVEVHASQGAADALHHPNPTTGLEAKFSMPYTVAAAIVRDRVGLAAFEDDAIDGPDVQAVRDRVTFDVDATLAYGSHATTVAIETTDGAVHERTREAPPWHPDAPPSEADLRSKFIPCATRVVDRATAKNAFDRLTGLRSCDDVAGLMETLQPNVGRRHP